MWHVVHIITRLDLGGAQLATLYEVANTTFAPRPATLVYGPGGLLEREARDLEGVSCRSITSLKRELSAVGDARALWQLVSTLREVRSDHKGARLLVHTHTGKAGILGRWAAWLAGADVIVHSAHGFGYNHNGSRAQQWLLRLAERITGSITDGFTADSAANIHQGRTDAVFGDAPARVVRCGIAIDTYASGNGGKAVRKALGIPLENNVVLNLSCLKRQKDPVSFVRLAAMVRDAAPDTTFLLAGDGELRGQVEKEIAAAGLGDHVKLLGWRRDVADLLQASDLLVLTSLWEGLPQSFFQAMAAGVPIVATRVDGAPEAIDHAYNGLLYDIGELPAMADGIVGLLNDPQRRKEMAHRGKQRVDAFSQERMVETLDRFYQELAATG